MHEQIKKLCIKTGMLTQNDHMLQKVRVYLLLEGPAPLP